MRGVFEHFRLGEQVYSQVVMPICDKHGLTYTEFTILMFLANNPALDTASDIVKYRNIAKSHVSVSVRSLVERGLITKGFRNGNYRSIHLSLADQATHIIQDGWAAQERFGRILFKGISDDEKKVMNDTLRRIDKNMTDYVMGVGKYNAE